MNDGHYALSGEMLRAASHPAGSAQLRCRPASYVPRFVGLLDNRDFFFLLRRGQP